MEVKTISIDWNNDFFNNALLREQGALWSD